MRFDPILGVFLGVSEFVLKDRTQKTQQKSVALALVERGDSAAVHKARDALKRLRDDAYAVPVDSNLERKNFHAIVARFDSHSQAKRNNARAPTPVFARYATLLQETNDHCFQQRFAALCNWRIVKALKVITSNTCIKTALPQAPCHLLCYDWVAHASARSP